MKKIQKVFIYDISLNQIDKIETEKLYDIKHENPIIKIIAKGYGISYKLVLKSIKGTFAVRSNERGEMIYVSLLDTIEFQKQKMFELVENTEKQKVLSSKSNSLNEHFHRVSKSISKEEKVDKTIGIVKWFNNKSKNGFITVSGSGLDVFLHESELKGITVIAGDRIEFQICKSKTGLYATQIKKIDTNLRNEIIEMIKKREEEWQKRLNPMNW